MTDSFLAAHMCAYTHAPMLCKHTHINISAVYCSICPVTLSAFTSHSKLLLSALPQATDDDSPPNNFLTYTITSASAFRNYFSIIMVEGYAGTLTFMSMKPQSRDVMRVDTSVPRR